MYTPAGPVFQRKAFQVLLTGYRFRHREEYISAVTWLNAEGLPTKHGKRIVEHVDCK